MMATSGWRHVWKLMLWAGLTLGFGANAPAAGLPGAVSANDAKSIRAVVQAQLDAFAADDAARAFALAAPNIRKQFGDAERFITMVRSGYPAVYRPTSVAFLVPERHEGELIQAVRLTDAAGKLWLAVYQMQRQPDKSWRIAGCEVVEIEGRVA